MVPGFLEVAQHQHVVVTYALGYHDHNMKYTCTYYCHPPMGGDLSIKFVKTVLYLLTLQEG